MEEFVPAKASWSGIVNKGQRLKITDLERQVSDFVTYYKTQRYHESLGTVTPADVYFERDKAIITERERIKKLTIQIRRL